MLADSQFLNLRNRFKKDAELLMQGVSAGDSNEKSQEEKDAKPLPRINRHSVFWIVASVGLTYYFDFLRVITENGDIRSWWFNVGVILLGICLALAMFCIVYLEWFKGIQHYDHEYPAIPPITTAAFLAASCSFNIALWPVWSFLTPVLLFTQFMGVVMLISMLG
ncbi:transmembrane protein 128-like [Oncorhynchus nerka]|uniref:Transmembrane protein 128 n=2 Tax=Oncorhynchus TaxID=8016 RepID=A0A8C7MPJ4_ONCKI|nr:transmembrane protein 128-like [Oncorhynchus kisutch]XP_024283707.1 transmembrane protein 128 [Oncorhynchus tshawytscha]XP_029539600.1 transmembrane protein 128-like isoform X1 [Oncorhynchus nerka]XP_046190093.1 transmembrane protein 128-like [Oncorhynchus gorbuscha]